MIPVKNRAKTIKDAIKSALAQKTDFKYNIIVVDNHSTDGTNISSTLLRLMGLGLLGSGISDFFVAHAYPDQPWSSKAFASGSTLDRSSLA